MQAACTQQLLTTHTALCVMPFCPSVHVKKFEKHRPGLPASPWHDIPSPKPAAQLYSLVGLVAFHHRLNRKQQSRSSPFALCTYTRCVDCPFCTGDSRRQWSTEVCSTCTLLIQSHFQAQKFTSLRKRKS